MFCATVATAQEARWVQVEAQPTLSAAQDRVRSYARQFQNVVGYYLGSGWYGIALGPYAPEDAAALLSQLRGAGQIPSDSFLADGSGFQQQFWPVGVAAGTRPLPLPGAAPQPLTAAPLAEAPQTDAPETDVPVVEAPITPALPDETVAEARASEALLDRPAREALQTALQWAGYYSAAIDGAFGRGTRNSMAAWQEANGYEVTGVLTTAQRAALIGAYNAILDGLEMAEVRDETAGIAIQMPTGAVAFAEYEPPFARYDATGEIAAQVLLISQPGDQDRLFGLYEILQTLAIVPLDGPRSRGERSFEIRGADATRETFVTARLEGGQIKGFALVWPAGDTARFDRVLALMQQSFTPLAGVLDPAIAPPGEDQAVDLVAGLEVRQPRLARSGFFIGADGTVLTTREAVAQCERISIDGAYDADVVMSDETAGIAVLRPREALAPLSVAAFQTAIPRLQSDVAVAGFPYGGVLTMPALTFGKLADLRGLDGNAAVKRLALTAQPGDAGGPVYDNGGAVLGMLLPQRAENGQVLPPDVHFSVASDVILAALDAAGIAAERTETLAFMPPETLTLRAADQTVLVSCW